MYGNDARNNGYLAAQPRQRQPRSPITNFQPVADSAGTCTTSRPTIPHPRRRSDVLWLQLHALDPEAVVHRHRTSPGTGVDQTSRSSTTTSRHRRYAARPSAAAASASSGSRRSTRPTSLNNPTAAAQSGTRDLARLPGCNRQAGAGTGSSSMAAGSAPSTAPAWGQTPPTATSATTRACTRGHPAASARRPRRRGHGRGLRRLRPGELVPGDPERRRPGDHPLVPPAGDHPLRSPRTASTTGPARTRLVNWADSAARILRPVAADGHDLATFPDLVPDPATGKITFDVDNDADGVTDSVWLDLGYPARPDSERPALQAAVRLHGHRPQRPDPAQHAPATCAGTARAPPTPRTWATRSASSTRPMPCRTPTRAPRSTPIPSTSPASACPLTRATPRWTTRGSTSG